MRTWSVIFLFLAVGLAQAQVTVQIILKQEQFLRDESLPLDVRIENRSGQALELGATPDWLTFTLETTEHTPVNQKRILPKIKPFSLESAAAAVQRMDLMPIYELSQPGRYVIRAHVRLAGFDQAFESANKTFDIGRGVESWSQEVGVPAKDGPVEVRRYGLVQASYKARPMLYARVTDQAQGEVYGVISLGPIVSFSRLEKIIDRQSKLHLLFQSGARTFLYCVVNVSGERVARETYSFHKDRPTLKVDNGEVHVAGGLRRLAPDDFPTPTDEEIQPSLTDADPTPR